MISMPVGLSPLQQLRDALACGEITPRAVTEQALARANSNANRNVYITLVQDWVLSQADGLAKRFAGKPKPPLYGLPISLKDCFNLSEFPTSCGSRYYAERNAAAADDSAVAARLREQGAVIIGKAHLHPLAYGITGENPDYGDCVQPGHPQWLTGGSSSGGAAGVMEGSAVAAIGTDTGGSIRVPAALCGLAGYRASLELAHRRGLWRGGMHLAQSFDTLGWLFLDLRDAPLLAEALFDLGVTEKQEKRAHIGCADGEFLRDCEPPAMQGLAYWKERLRDAGAEVVMFDAEFWGEARDIYAPIQAHEAAVIHTRATGGDFSHFEKSIAERLAWGASLSEAEVEAFRQRHAAFRERVDELLRDFDFLIAPCAPVCRLAAGAAHTETRRAILRYTTPLSLAGTPVVTLPAEGGAGVQLAAARGADERLLSFAAGLET